MDEVKDVGLLLLLLDKQDCLVNCVYCLGRGKERGDGMREGERGGEKEGRREG